MANKQKSTKVPISVKKYVKRAIDNKMEDKMIVTDPAAAGATDYRSINNTFVDCEMCNPSQSTAGAGRIGRKVSIKSFQLRGVVAGGQTNAVTDDDYNVFRIVLAVWEGNTTTPLAGLSLSSPIQKGDGNASNALLIHKYVDKEFTLTSPGRDSTGYMSANRYINIYHRFKKPIVVNYATDANTSKSKTLVLSMVSDSSAVAHPGFVSGFIRVNYEDA